MTKYLSNEIGVRLQILLTTLYSILSIIGRIYIFSEEINKETFTVTIAITKLREVTFSTSNCFCFIICLLMHI